MHHPDYACGVGDNAHRHQGSAIIIQEERRGGQAHNRQDIRDVVGAACYHGDRRCARACSAEEPGRPYAGGYVQGGPRVYKESHLRAKAKDNGDHEVPVTGYETQGVVEVLDDTNDNDVESSQSHRRPAAGRNGCPRNSMRERGRQFPYLFILFVPGRERAFHRP